MTADTQEKELKLYSQDGKHAISIVNDGYGDYEIRDVNDCCIQWGLSPNVFIQIKQILKSLEDEVHDR